MFGPLNIAGLAVLIGLLDPAWAPAMNTALLFLLALFQAHQARELQTAKVAARDAKRAAGAARRDSALTDTGDRRRVTDK